MRIISKFKNYDVDFISNLQLVESFISDKTTYFVIDKNIYSLYKNELKNHPFFLIGEKTPLLKLAGFIGAFP